MRDEKKGTGTVTVQCREDGLPLIALPVNPRRTERPLNAARPLLAYHQFLFRTLPVLFPSENMLFWRDGICEAALEIEYVFNAITALGTMHRAVLLLSQANENDRSRGLDSKVMAVQWYIKALQSLSENLEDARKYPDIMVGVLLLLAYFEVRSQRECTAAFLLFRP